MPTAPIVVPSQQYTAQPYEPQLSPKRRPNKIRRALLRLLSLGLLLELFFLADYPLLAGATPRNDAAKQALLGLFPLLEQLSAPLLKPASGNSNIGFLLLLLGLSFGCTLFAGRVGSRVVRERLSRSDIRVFFSTIIIITFVFAITFLFAPAVLSQDMFLYGIYGRLVTVYHVNPYVVSLNSYPHDLLHPGNITGAPIPGPVWIDLSIPIMLLARESVANIIMSFRALGLVVHLVNAALIWIILARLKPETRISATLLYAWNPLVLLLSVSSMHVDAVLVLFMLLAVLFFQRNSPILGWVFMLLAMLMNMLCLLLLPLFFRLLMKEARVWSPGRRTLWWLAVIGISGVVVALAYAPYWQGWGIVGFITSLRHTFLQDTAINSLDAALINLPVKLPLVLFWLVVPHHWTLFAIVTIGCLLLLGLWLADTIEFVVLFSSWILLALLVLLPIYWPWYVILPLTIALCSASRRTILLAVLLTLGALGSCYFWLWQPVWLGQGLVILGLPLLVWGWILFFTSTWEMTHVNQAEPPVKQTRRGLSRPSLPSFPSRPSWPARRR